MICSTTCRRRWDTALPWTYDFDQAIHLQESLRQRLVLTWDSRPVNIIAGIDFNYTPSTVLAGIALFSYPEMTHLQEVVGQAPLTFPYSSGLLAYRVGPAILSAWEKLKPKPDVVLVHGHGIAHPRGVGLASHIGLWTNTPSIGVAKTRLYGQQAETGSKVGDWSELRTREGCKPVYVSPGHLVDIRHAMEFTLASSRDCRMPEPVRAAHHAAVTYKNVVAKN